MIFSKTDTSHHSVNSYSSLQKQQQRCYQKGQIAMRFKNPFHLQKFQLEVVLTRVLISKWPLTLLALHLSTQIATIQVGQYIPTHSTSHKVDRVSLQYLHRFPQEQSNLLSGKVTKSKHRTLGRLIPKF